MNWISACIERLCVSRGIERKGVQWVGFRVQKEAVVMESTCEELRVLVAELSAQIILLEFALDDLVACFGVD